MFGKLINGQLVFAGERIPISNGWATKPSEEVLRANGYKEIEYTEKPAYDDEEEKLVETYRTNLDETTILVCYEKVTLTNKEHNQIIQDKIIQEENKIMPRRQREIDLKETKLIKDNTILWTAVTQLNNYYGIKTY